MNGKCDSVHFIVLNPKIPISTLNASARQVPSVATLIKGEKIPVYPPKVVMADNTSGGKPCEAGSNEMTACRILSPKFIIVEVIILGRYYHVFLLRDDK